MAEDIEEKSTGGFDIPRYLGIVRRRHMQFLIPLLFGWLVVWGISWVLPSRYRSSTLILYNDPKGNASPDEKVERMRHEIEIDLVRDPENRVTSFNVAYSSRDPR